MSDVEYREFVGVLLASAEEFFNDIKYFTTTVKPTKIKMIMYGEKWRKVDFFVFKDICIDLSRKFQSEFKKFNISPTPQLYFCKERQTLTVKWFVNIDQWLPTQ